MIFKNFYKKSQAEIIRLLKEFIEHDFFVHFPELKNKVSIIIVGSISFGRYDRHSDIDLGLLFPDKKLKERYMGRLQSYKRSILPPSGISLQGGIHTFDELKKNLDGWEKDMLLREFTGAIALCDPRDKFGRIQKQFKWYPRDIYKEKVNWLFAEAVFNLVGRFQVAMWRKDGYYAESSKIKVMQLLLNAILLAYKKYPIYDKHLYKEVGSLENFPSGLILLIDRIIFERRAAAAFRDLIKLKKIVERLLLSKKLIKRADDKYWVHLRPKYKVQLG